MGDGVLPAARAPLYRRPAVKYLWEFLRAFAVEVGATVLIALAAGWAIFRAVTAILGIPPG